MRQENVYHTSAELTNTRTNVTIEAEVADLRENESLNAYVASEKIHMRWNGKVYVGNAHGMELTTQGPKLIRSIKGRY